MTTLGVPACPPGLFSGSRFAMGQGAATCCRGKQEETPLEMVDARMQFPPKAMFPPLPDPAKEKATTSIHGDMPVKAEDDFDAEDSTTADTLLGSSPSPNCRLMGSEELAAPADFGGSWLCTHVSGDVNGFMKDVGLGPVMREAAQAAHYGAGRQMQNIAQVGDAFVVQNILREPVTMRFRVGAGLQSTVDQDGKPVFIEPYWDREVLCVVSKREDGGPIANSRRYLDGDAMVLEITSPNGAVVRRIFERR